jgi:hypothetical protein
VPLSIVGLHALDCGPRADAILDRLQLQLAPAERQTFGARNAARLPCRLLPDEARADVEHRLEAIDADWREYIVIPRAATETVEALYAIAALQAALHRFVARLTPASTSPTRDSVTPRPNRATPPAPRERAPIEGDR